MLLCKMLLLLEEGEKDIGSLLAIYVDRRCSMSRHVKIGLDDFEA